MAAPKKPKAKRQVALVAAHVTSDEHAQFARIARRREMSISELVRNLLRKEADRS